MGYRLHIGKKPKEEEQTELKEIHNQQDLIDVVGKKTYTKLLKENNLCTKKWTRGRTKKFYAALTKILKEKAKQLQKEGA